MRKHVRWLRAGFWARVVFAVVAGTVAAGCAAPASQHVTAAGATVQPGIPRYYVTLDTRGPITTFGDPLAVATVRVTATSAVIARISAPRPYKGFTAVTGAADDRTFVLLANAPTDPFTGATPQRFFVLRIDPGAQSATARARLTPLPTRDIPDPPRQAATNPMLGEQVGTMALSPEGNSLAAIVTVGGKDYLYIYNLATGKTRSWVWKPCSKCDQIPLSNPLSGNPSIPALSWISDGRSVAFTLMSVWPIVTQLWLLHPTTRGNTVVADSSLFAIHAPVSAWEQAVITPDGKTVFLKLDLGTGEPQGSFKLMRISTATGQLATINTLPMILTAGYANSGPLTADTILWTNDDGSKVIIADARPGHTLGIYHGGRYAPLPWPAHAVAAAW